jgi:hypothetical protein
MRPHAAHSNVHPSSKGALRKASETLWASLTKLKPRRSAKAKGLTTQCDKKIVLLNFKSGDQKPL